LQKTIRSYFVHKQFKLTLEKIAIIQGWLRCIIAQNNIRRFKDDTLAAEIEIKRVAKETEIKCRRRSSFFHRLWSSAEKPDRKESNEDPYLEIKRLKMELDSAMFETQKLKAGLENTLSENRSLRVELAEKSVMNDNLLAENSELKNILRDERAGYEEIMMFNNQAKHEYHEKMESSMKEKLDNVKVKYEIKLRKLVDKYKELKRKYEEEQNQKQILLEDNENLKMKATIEHIDEVDQLRNDNQVQNIPLITTIPLDSDHDQPENEEVFNDKFLNDMKHCRNFKKSSPDTSFEEDRIMELSKRNSMLPPHMRSSYSSEWFNTSEIKESDLQQGLLNEISSAKKPRADTNNNEVSHSADTSYLDHSKFF